MTLQEQVQDMRNGRKRWRFTLESGHGQTYSNNKATLYGHSTYERGSVLAGRPQRVFVRQWDSWDEARKELAALRKVVKGFKFDDYGPSGGSTHIDHDTLLAGIPDDADY